MLVVGTIVLNMRRISESKRSSSIYFRLAEISLQY